MLGAKTQHLATSIQHPIEVPVTDCPREVLIGLKGRVVL